MGCCTLNSSLPDPVPYRSARAHWNDCKDVSVHGKLAVVLINDADSEADAPGAFEGKAAIY